MKLKTIETDGNIYAVLVDGKPVYTDSEGKDHKYDAPAMRASLDKLNGVLGDERAKLQTIQDKFKDFDGLDAKAARSALEMIDSIDKKTLVDAGEIEKVRKEISAGFEAKLKVARDEKEDIQSKYKTEKINGAFAGSKFVKDRLAIPADMVQSAFAKNFQFENGSLKPVDSNGNPIYSESNPAELASFDEALERIVSQYPSRDQILKSNGSGGSGSGPIDEGSSRSKMSRSDFDKLPPAKQHQIATKGEIQITD